MKENGILKEQWSGDGARLGMLEKGRIQESSEPFPGPKGAAGELERDWDKRQDIGNGFPLGKGRLGWDIGKESLAGLEFPGLHPWDVQGGLGAAWDSGDDPSPWNGMSLKLLPIPNHSLLLDPFPGAAG